MTNQKLIIEWGHMSGYGINDQYYCTYVFIVGINGKRKLLIKFDCSESEAGANGHAMKAAKSYSAKQSKFYGCEVKFIGNLQNIKLELE